MKTLFESATFCLIHAMKKRKDFVAHCVSKATHQVAQYYEILI
jgi:hypothetical protein